MRCGDRTLCSVVERVKQVVAGNLRIAGVERHAEKGMGATVIPAR